MERHLPKSREQSPLRPKKLPIKARTEHYSDLFVIGWREWVALPDLGIDTIKVKVDTGARTSALHAYDIEEFTRNKKHWVRFKIHPLQRNNKVVTKAEAKIIEKRHVKDSGGRTTIRPVIATTIKIGNLSWDIELTLIDRSEMGFRMLLGREAVKNHLLVHPGKSYLIGAQPLKKDKGTQQ